MKNKIFCWAVIVITLVIDAYIIVHFHNWCADMPRDSVLWYNGALDAYSTTYFLSLCIDIVISIPAMLCAIELKTKALW